MAFINAYAIKKHQQTFIDYPSLYIDFYTAENCTENGGCLENMKCIENQLNSQYLSLIDQKAQK